MNRKDIHCTFADLGIPEKSWFHSRWSKIRHDVAIIFVMVPLVASVMFLIYQEPDQTPRLLSLERHSGEMSQINEESRNYRLAGDVQNFNDSKKSMQEKLKEASHVHMGLEISNVDLIDGHYPFRDSQEIVEKSGLDPSSACDFVHKIPLHMQTISQTEKFGQFATKYSQYEIEFYIMDERRYLSNVHYGLVAANDKGQRASTHFHLNSCTGEVTDMEPYFLHCSDENDGYRFATFNRDDIVSSLSSHHFCRIELDPWRQSMFEYGQALREQRWEFQTELMNESVDPESHRGIILELGRQADLENIVGQIVHGKFDRQGVQDMIALYQEQYGSLPEELLDLIEVRP